MPGRDGLYVHATGPVCCLSEVGIAFKRGGQHRLQQGVYRAWLDLSFCSLEVGA